MIEYLKRLSQQSRQLQSSSISIQQKRLLCSVTHHRQAWLRHYCKMDNPLHTQTEPSQKLNRAMHRLKATFYCFRTREIPLLHIWKESKCGNRLQATGDNISQASPVYTENATKNAIAPTEIRDQCCL